MAVAVYPGTFDPITNGHLDIIERGLEIFDRIIIAIAENEDKAPLFTIKEREEMISIAVEPLNTKDRIKIQPFGGLLVDFVKNAGGKAILRGLRAVSDFEYEFQMAITNRKLGGDVETIFLMSTERYSYLSSSIVKEVAKFGGNVSDMVPGVVLKGLDNKFRS